MPRAADPLTRLRTICLALPFAEEFISHGAPNFRVVKGRSFATFADNHHDDGRVAAWLKAAPGTQEMLVESSPDRFFRPPYVGPSGWVGVLLDAKTDWSMLAALVEEGWRLVAPKKALAASVETKKPMAARKAAAATTPRAKRTKASPRS